jgi:hypothetical protein
MVTAIENVQKVETTINHFRGRMNLKTNAKGEVQLDCTLEFAGDREEARTLLKEAKEMMAETVTDLVETYGIKIAKE